jgi:hypothetical protein
VFLFCISCSDQEAYEKIAGEWECLNWLTESGGKDKCNNNVYFEFSLDKTYQSKLGNVVDSGKYKIQNETLYVSPKGKMELAVKIEKLDNDSLIFLMNQAGVKEILILKKK